MYYNQKQRNEIYKDAYEIIKNKTDYFVCHAINRACDVKIETNKKEFPELFLFKDEEDYAFLSKGDFDTKKDYYKDPKMITRKLWVLAFCIAMTE